MASISRSVLAAWLLLALHLSLPVAAAPFNRSSSLIQKRSISISVLKASSAVTNGCTPDQITAINTAVGEGKQLAAGATLALANPKIKTSTNFKNWMGASNNPLTINAEHFLPISTNLNEASTQVDNLDNLGQNDLTYVCPPESACGSGSPGEVTASTRNFNTAKAANDVTNRNLIQFCPVFFGTGSTSSKTGNQPQSLAQATTNINSVPPVPFNVVPSMAIVHEVQHSIPIVGSLARVRDLKATDPKTNKLVKAYSLRICRDVLTDAQKITNAQSFAWFAFFAHANPNLNTDDCNAPATAAPSTSGTKTPPAKAPPAKIPRSSLSVWKLRAILGRAPIKIPTSVVEEGAEDAEKGLGSIIGKLNPFSKGDPAPPKAPAAPPKAPTPPKEETPPKETAPEGATKVTETAAATKTATEATATKTTATEASSTSTASKSTASTSETTTSAASSSSSSASSTSSSSSTSASATPSACAIQNKTFDSLTTFVDEDEDADGNLAD